MDEGSVVVGIYIGFSKIDISCLMGQNIANEKSILGENSYPIIHSNRQLYGEGAMAMLFTEPNYLASNLLYLLSLKDCSNNAMNSAYYVTPSSVQSTTDGFLVTGDRKSVEDMLQTLFSHTKNWIDNNIRPNYICIALPFDLKGTPTWYLLCEILDKIFNKEYEVKDSVTSFMLCQSMSQFKSGESYSSVLVIDEHHTYCTRVHVYNPNKDSNGDSNMNSLNEIDINSISDPQFIEKKVETLISLIRNKLIETELRGILHKEGIAISRDNQDYLLFAKQLYIYISYNLFSWRTSHDYRDFSFTLHGHDYTVRAERMKDACEDWIQTFVNSVIKHLMMDCTKNYSPENSLYITGDYGCLFSEQRLGSFKKQYESKGVGLYLLKKDDSSFSTGAIRFSKKIRYAPNTSSILFSMTN